MRNGYIPYQQAVNYYFPNNWTPQLGYRYLEFLTNSMEISI